MLEPSENLKLSDTHDSSSDVDGPVITIQLSDALAIENEIASARSYGDNARSSSTKRAYAADLRHFCAWCMERGLSPLPADAASVAFYCAWLADSGSAFATIKRRLAAISGAHRDRGMDSPTTNGEVRRIVAGIARTIGTQQKRKDALGFDLLRQALETFDASLNGTRDRAILLLGFSGAFRRSELVALDVADLKFSRKGALVTLRRSKTDQDGQGRQVAIPTAPIANVCAVRAVKAWLQVARIVEGPLLRGVDRGVVEDRRVSDASIARLVKRAAKAAGISGYFAGHSLRSGFATSAAENGASDRGIMRTTGHRSREMLERYIQRGNAFEASALLEIMK